MTAKLYRKPFWWMLVLFVLITLYYLYVISVYIKLDYWSPEIRRAVIIRYIIVIGIVLAEVIAYWLMRKRIYRRLWANMHVILTYLSLLGSTILFAVLRVLFDYITSPENSYSRAEMARSIFFWTCIIAGHLFFIATIAKSFSRRQPEQPHADKTANLLDEFAE